MQSSALDPRPATRALLALLACASLAPAQATPAPPAAPANPPAFRFALVADVQYADKPDSGKRRYASSLARLTAAVEDWADEDLVFTVQLGDLLDGSESDATERVELEAVLAQLARAPQPVHHVIGNHCLELPRPELQQRLELERSWTSFSEGGWRFLVVDSIWLGSAGRVASEPLAADAARWLERHADRPEARPWNGALGPVQRAWLADELADAAAQGQRAVIFSHLPVHPESSSPGALLWDHREVLALLERAPAFHAWIAGHHHAGGYAQIRGRHFLTLRGMVEAPAGDNAYAVVEATPGGLAVDGRGQVVDRLLALSDETLAAGAFTPRPTEQTVPARTSYLGRTIARTMHWRGAEWLLRASREEEEAPAAMLDALGVVEGSTVVDFGCGNGFHSLRLAERVGPEGSVLGVDIQPEMLRMLQYRAKQAGVDTVEPVLSTALETGLTPASVDLVLMVDVYHELDRPELVLDQVRQSLRAGGRLALVEFRAEDEDVPIKPEHKMSAAQILREMEANGFALEARDDSLPWQHLMVFRAAW